MITTQKFAVGDRVSWPGAGGDGTVIGMDVKNSVGTFLWWQVDFWDSM